MTVHDNKTYLKCSDAAKEIGYRDSRRLSETAASLELDLVQLDGHRNAIFLEHGDMVTALLELAGKASPVKKSQIKKYLRSIGHAKVNGHVPTAGSGQADDKLESEVRDKLERRLEAEVRDMLENKLRDEVKSELRDKLNNEVREHVVDTLNDMLLKGANNEVRSKLKYMLKDVLGSMFQDKPNDVPDDKLNELVKTVLKTGFGDKLKAELRKEEEHDVTLLINRKLRWLPAMLRSKAVFTVSTLLLIGCQGAHLASEENVLSDVKTGLVPAWIIGICLEVLLVIVSFNVNVSPDMDEKEARNRLVMRWVFITVFALLGVCFNLMFYGLIESVVFKQIIMSVSIPFGIVMTTHFSSSE